MNKNILSKISFTGLVLLLVLLLFIPDSAAAQDEIKKQGSDPLQGKQPVDTVQIQALFEQSELSNDPDSAIAIAKRAIQLSDDAGYETGKATGFRIIGEIFYNVKGDLTEASKYYNLALRVYEKEGDTTGISQSQNGLGSVYAELGDRPKALDFYIKSLRNAEVVSDTLRMATAYMNLGTVYQEDKATYPQAIENYQRAIELFGSGNDREFKEGIAASQINFGDWYVETDKSGEAIPYLQQALIDFREIGFPPAFPLNSLGKAYFELDQLEVAKQYYDQALAEATKYPLPGEEATTHLGLGRINLKLGKHARAIEDFEKALDLAKETGVLVAQSESYEGLSKAYAAINDFNSAFEAQQEYAKIMDELRTADYAEQMSTLRVSFGLDNMEKQNDLLQAKNELNELQIEQAKRDEQLYLIILGLFLAIIAGFVFQYFYIRRTNKRLAYERNRSEEILLNILPKETADELKENGFVKTQELDEVTVLFTDFKAFSSIAERITAEELIRSVDFYFKAFDEITERNNVEKIKTIGDAYMCAAGLPYPNETHAYDAFRAAREILQFVKDTELNPPKGIYPFQIRIGLNTGPVVSGVVGTKKFAYDIWGNTVNIAARMESGSIAGRINVSENTYKFLKDDHDFTYRGEVEVKNGLILKMYFAEVQDAVPA